MSRSPILKSIYDFMQPRRYSKHTIETYLYWIKAFIYFQNKRHPKELGEHEVSQFLTHLAANKTVSSSIQCTALNALVLVLKDLREHHSNRLANRQNRSVIKHNDRVVIAKCISLLLWFVAYHNFSFSTF